MRYFSYFLLIFLFAASGCGNLSSNTNTPNPSSGSGDDLKDFLVVLGSSFADPAGTLGLIPTDAPRAPSTNLQTTHSDAVVRSQNNLLYVVNRKGADNIQVVDPAQNFAVTKQFSVGPGTNPQDIVVISATKAYVALYEPESVTDGTVVDDILVVDPQAGTILKTIDMTGATAADGDRFARAADLLQVGSKVLVLLQDRPGDFFQAPDQPGRVVAIDTATDIVTDIGILSCYNPIAMAQAASTGLVYITCADFSGVASNTGGIEVVDSATLQSSGIFITDNNLGGAPGDIEVSGDKGFVTVGVVSPSFEFSSSVLSFSLDVNAAPNLQPLYEGADYIQDIAVAPNGLLVVGDQTPTVNGVLFLNSDSGAVVDGPISMGLPPSSFAFIQR
jgi:hypothetical protein